MLGKRDFEKAQVKNKAPAARQITAEQLLRESVDGQPLSKAPVKEMIADASELSTYQMGKRKEFEDGLRRNRHNIGTWIRYAKWEETQEEYRRARSVYERALQIDYQNIPLWTKYIEMEISHKFIQHARTLYDRVTGLLPRVEQFWYKYAYMEERLENYAGARAIYEKWMNWQPTDNAWLQFVKFEERCGETGRARSVFERYIQQAQSVLCFTRYCKFEERNKEFEKARAGYETCVQLVDASDLNEDIFIKYAQFEVRRGDFEKANRVYKLGLLKLGPERSRELYAAYVLHTKQTGSRDEIEQLLIDKRRAHYERLLAEEPENWDACFNYIRMEEEAGEVERVRELYERSLGKVPSKKSKNNFKRYIYLWLFYAQFEESVAGDVDRARSVYATATKLCEAAHVFFSKLTKAFGEFELRQLEVEKFRAVMRQALHITEGKKKSIPRFWLETELKLGNVNQARRVAAELVEVNPGSASSWLSFIDLEMALGEAPRAVALCNVALQNGASIDDMKPIIRKHIEIESAGEADVETMRKLFKQLLDADSTDAESYLAFAEFELNESVDRSCAILEEGLELIPDERKSERQRLRSRLQEILQDKPTDNDF